MGELVGAGLAHVQQVLPQRPVASPGPLGHDHVVARRHLGEHLDPLEGAPDPEPWPACGRACRRGRVRRSTPCPLLGRSCPHMQLNSVVFPAPLGPTSPTASPAATRDRHVLEGGDSAEADGDRAGVEQRCRRRPTAEGAERRCRCRACPPAGQPPNGFPEGTLTRGERFAIALRRVPPGRPAGGPALRARRAS